MFIKGISKNDKFVTPNQLSKFKAKNWVEVNHESQGTYDKDNHIRFKTSMLNNGANRKAIFKSCAPFTKCVSKINNTQ